jgi:hypothetical protein
VIQLSGLDPDDLRARLARMSDRELLEWGKAAAYMCTPYANLGQPPRKPLVMQLKAARAEWRHRHGPDQAPDPAPRICTIKAY